MIIITPEHKLADVVLRNYHLIPVINRFGIELGFGEKTIAEICMEYQIDADFFSALLNTISFESYNISEKKLKVVNTSQLIQYLKNTLENYTDSQISVIEIHIRQLLNSSPEKNPHLQLIENFFIQFKEEFLQYVEDVNHDLFYSVITIHTQYICKKKKSSDDLTLPDFNAFQERYYPLSEKLSDMKSLLIKYLIGNFDRRVRNAIIYIISRFETDMHDYMRLQHRLLGAMTKDMLTQIQQANEE